MLTDPATRTSPTAFVLPDRATVAVLGLGYVDLPVALTCAEAGFRVVGVDAWLRKQGIGFEVHAGVSSLQALLARPGTWRPPRAPSAPTGGSCSATGSAAGRVGHRQYAQRVCWPTGGNHGTPTQPSPGGPLA